MGESSGKQRIKKRKVKEQCILYPLCGILEFALSSFFVVALQCLSCLTFICWAFSFLVLLLGSLLESNSLSRVASVLAFMFSVKMDYVLSSSHSQH